MRKYPAVITTIAAVLSLSFSAHGADLGHHGIFYNACVTEADKQWHHKLPNGEYQSIYFCNCFIDEMAAHLTDQEWALGQLGISMTQPNGPMWQHYRTAYREATITCMNKELKLMGQAPLTKAERQKTLDDLPIQ
jgi:hypothetical protein